MSILGTVNLTLVLLSKNHHLIVFSLVSLVGISFGIIFAYPTFGLISVPIVVSLVLVFFLQQYSLCSLRT